MDKCESYIKEARVLRKYFKKITLQLSINRIKENIKKISKAGDEDEVGKFRR